MWHFLHNYKELLTPNAFFCIISDIHAKSSSLIKLTSPYLQIHSTLPHIADKSFHNTLTSCHGGEHVFPGAINNRIPPSVPVQTIFMGDDPMTTDEFKHKLTAILSADVQGYSRLMEDDETSTIRTLTSYRSLMSAIIERHEGHVVDTPGDNLLAEFGSVMDAVRCAVEIQEELRLRNADLPDNRKMQFRIGINLGDIVEDGHHIYGDGVNIAARVEGLAEGGGICISGTVYDAIRNKLSMSYEFMGEHVVKNIKEMVRIYRIKVEPEAETVVPKAKKARFRTWQWAAISIAAIIILGAVAYVVFDKVYIDRDATEPEMVSTEAEQVPVVSDMEKVPSTIAVLPFDDLSPEKDQEYFVLGLSEEILNSLAQIQDLTVIAKTSSFSFKGKDKTIQEIASVLGVENILEGSVRKVGDALRITVQLVKAVDGSHIWSKTYDRELKYIFDVQEDIATSVANELKATLGIDKALKQLGGTENEKAYEYYLFAQGQCNSFELNLALQSLDSAIAIDPKFALAWALKAQVQISNSVGMPANRLAKEQEAVLQAAQRAIELEPNLAEAYAALGLYKSAKHEWVEAEVAYRKALSLTTEPFLKVGNYDKFLVAVGYFRKANKVLEAALRNDPRNFISRIGYMQSFGYLGDIQEAEEENQRGFELFGKDTWNIDNAWIRPFRLRLDKSVSLDEIFYLAGINDNSKDHIKSPKDALEELHRMVSNSDSDTVVSDFISLCSAGLGDPEFAITVLEKTYKSKYLFNTELIWVPVMKEVRKLPRFKKFVREIGLVDYWNKFGWPDICRPLDNGDFECD